MDFLKLVKSLEELLYELMAWLVFYPRTLWRVVVHPLDMMHYTEQELGDEVNEQYTDTLSPPLFLMLTVLVAHGIELALGDRTPRIDSALGKTLIGSEQNLLVFRSIFFALFALVTATTLIRQRGLALDRKTLRAPFFGQCYLTAPFALAFSVAASLSSSHSSYRPLAVALLVAGFAWYLWTETAWFRRQLAAGTGRAFALAVWSFTRAAAYSLILALMLLRK